MNTTITTVAPSGASTATAAPILALDLSKYKSVVCLYRAADE